MPEHVEVGLGLDSEAFEAQLREYRQNVEDPRAMWDQAVDYMADRERRVWQTHGASQGTPWPAAGDRSRRGSRRGKGRRPRVRRSHELMVLTGALRRSLTEVKGRGGVRRRTRTALTFGTRVKTANLHQNEKRGGRMPRRPVLLLDRRDSEMLARLVERSVWGASSGAGRLRGGRPL